MYHLMMLVTFLFESCSNFNNAFRKLFNASLIFSPPWIAIGRPHPAALESLPRRFQAAGTLPLVGAGSGIALTATPAPGDHQKHSRDDCGKTKYRSRSGSAYIEAFSSHGSATTCRLIARFC